MSQDRKRTNGAVLFSVILRAAVLLLFLSAATWWVIRYSGHMWRILTDVAEEDKLQQWVVSWGVWGPVVFLGIQMLQIVVFVIPGEVVQAAAGYIFGLWGGVAYCLVGAGMGSALAFLLAQWLGRPLVRYLLGTERFDRMEDVLNRRKGIISLFLLFLIPGVPKDVLCYVAGLTPMHAGRFLVVSTLARLPGIWMSVYIGREMAEKSYIEMAIVLGLAGLGLVLGLIFQKRIEAWISRRKAGTE